MDFEDDLFEKPVFTRHGIAQYRFVGYSYCYFRLTSFHRKRPYRAL